MADTAGPKKDVYYDFKYLITRKAEHAARLSVLHPLTHPPKGAKHAELLSLGTKLMGTWRHRLLEWQTVGWKFSRQPSQVVRMRNCPPAAFRTSKSSCVPCQRDAFCPWCAGRKVVDLYNIVAANVTNVGEQLLTAVGRQKGDGKRPLVKAVHRASETLRKLFLANMGSLDDSGGYSQITVEPYDGDWLITSRLLVLYPMDKHFDLIPSEWRTRGKIRPAPDDIVSAVARATRYPVGLMLGDAARAAEAINSREGMKLCTHFGTFRGDIAARLAGQSQKKAKKASTAPKAIAPKPKKKPVAQDPVPEVQTPAPEAPKKKLPSLDWPSWFSGVD